MLILDRSKGFEPEMEAELQFCCWEPKLYRLRSVERVDLVNPVVSDGFSVDEPSRVPRGRRVAGETGLARRCSSYCRSLEIGHLWFFVTRLHAKAFETCVVGCRSHVWSASLHKRYTSCR